MLSRRTAVAICAVIAGFAFTATAIAGPPTATTGAASSVTGTTATLTGVVFPNKETTTYHFEYGTTATYGSKTPAATAAGNSEKTVSASIAGLVPLTTYHFRLVADNPSGDPATGADMTFTTTSAPAAITISASRTVVTFGGQVTFTDGPYAESKETIVSFALLDVRSKEEAIELSRRFWQIVRDGEGDIRQVFGPE